MLLGIRKLIILMVLFSILLVAFSLENRNQVITGSIAPSCQATDTCQDVVAEGITVRAITVQSARPFDHYLLWLAAGLAAATILAVAWTNLRQNTQLVS
jgi:hypothetical protein